MNEPIHPCKVHCVCVCLCLSVCVCLCVCVYKLTFRRVSTWQASASDSSAMTQELRSAAPKQVSPLCLPFAGIKTRTMRCPERGRRWPSFYPACTIPGGHAEKMKGPKSFNAWNHFPIEDCWSLFVFYVERKGGQVKTENREWVQWLEVFVSLVHNDRSVFHRRGGKSYSRVCGVFVDPLYNRAGWEKEREKGERHQDTAVLVVDPLTAVFEDRKCWANISLWCFTNIKSVSMIQISLNHSQNITGEKHSYWIDQSEAFMENTVIKLSANFFKYVKDFLVTLAHSQK